MTKRYWLSWCWQLGIAGFLGWLGVSAFASQTLAQSNIVPDNTLGAESSVVIDNFQGLPIEIITGGATRGVNLFHSFREFNVSEGRGAYFFPDASIQNILARVTGSNRSEILGILGVQSSSAPNLFLMNPNGIVFGANASLNVGGSFVATSANALKLGDVGLFSASQPATSNLLTVSPSALLFNAIANQEIVNRSTTGLKVPEGRSLLLVGGKVNLDKGVVQASGGRVELGGVSGSGTISLNVDGNNLSLGFPENLAKADVSLNQANIDVSGVGGGSVQVQGDSEALLLSADRVTFNTGSSINSYTIGNQNSGDIFIRASQLEFTGNSAISTITNGVGKGGDITIKTGSLTLQDNSAIFTGSLFAAGRAGDVTIEATDFVNLNQSRFGTLSLGTGDGTTTNTGGNISIKTQNFSLNNFSGIAVSTFFGKGNAGNLSIQATNSVNLDNSVFSTSSFGAGTGGDILIDTKNLRVQNGSNIVTSTIDPRNADINSLQANNSSITTSAIQAGGGDISVTAKNIRLRNNSDIRTNLSSGQESGGNIFLSANTIIALEDSDILAFAPEGKGGNITFNTRAFLSDPLYRPTQTTSDATTLQALDGNSRVDVNATGAVTSGNIVGIPDITFLQNSLNELPQNLIDANALIANSCIARRNNPQQGTFLITGSGGLPERPGDAPLSHFPTSGVQNVPKDGESATSRRPWKIGDPIVEPQGVYRLANGQRVLSRECP